MKVWIELLGGTDGAQSAPKKARFKLRGLRQISVLTKFCMLRDWALA
jgi:hypothetical protein